MSYKCCGNDFNDLNLYAQHLRFHSKYIHMNVLCNACGQISTSWNAFRKHNLRNHNLKRFFKKNTNDENSESPFDNFFDLLNNDVLDDESNLLSIFLIVNIILLVN